MKKKHLSQSYINRINLIIAIIALFISFPSVFNQLNEFLKNHFSIKKTQVIYYSPPTIYDLNFSEADEGFCWMSIASNRNDAARCDNNSFIYDPCFFVSMFGDEDVYYYYCPSSKDLDGEGVLVKTSKDELKVFDSNTEDDLGLPWRITFGDGATCYKHTGTVDPAFGNKRIIYGCDKDIEVTENKISEGNYFFSCRYKGKKYYEECLAKIVVF